MTDEVMRRAMDAERVLWARALQEPEVAAAMVRVAEAETRPPPAYQAACIECDWLARAAVKRLRAEGVDDA